MEESYCTMINTSSINYVIECIFHDSKKCNIFTAKAIRYQCARSLTDKWIHNWSYLILQ